MPAWVPEQRRSIAAGCKAASPKSTRRPLGAEAAIFGSTRQVPHAGEAVHRRRRCRQAIARQTVWCRPCVRATWQVRSACERLVGCDGSRTCHKRGNPNQPGNAPLPVPRHAVLPRRTRVPPRRQIHLAIPASEGMHLVCACQPMQGSARGLGTARFVWSAARQTAGRSLSSLDRTCSGFPTHPPRPADSALLELLVSAMPPEVVSCWHQLRLRRDTGSAPRKRGMSPHRSAYALAHDSATYHPPNHKFPLQASMHWAAERIGFSDLQGCTSATLCHKGNKPRHPAQRPHKGR
mmetsp:Transcript_155359/g.498443  ORF Transcript_155359/g.498443 Transcript_155359/m.498443 type:complete len:293 (+) Transcript_155359:1881-2759(+)